MSRYTQIEPEHQIVYPWGLDISSEIQEGLSKIYKSIGNNIVLKGFSTTINHTKEKIKVTVQAGSAIQDMTFLSLETDTPLELNVSSFSATGAKVVCYILYNKPAQKFELGLQYVNNSPDDVWNLENNKVVLDSYIFKKDANNEIKHVSRTDDNYIVIKDKQYQKKGLHSNNIYFSELFSVAQLTSKYVTTNYKASENEIIFADTSNDEIEIELPDNPPLGTKITLIDCGGEFWRHPVRINPGESSINGVNHKPFFKFQHSITDFYYAGSNKGWIYNITRMWTVKGGTF